MASSKKLDAYYQVCKPKVVMMMLLTALIGMLLVPSWQYADFSTFFLGLLGIGLLSCAGGAFNQVLDIAHDRLMRRTQSRPLVQNHLSVREGFLWGIFLSVSGFVLLFFLVNHLTAWLSLFAFVGYAFFYTCFLKYKTPQNIVIGGFFGALPPLLGWTAVTGTIDPYPLVLVMVIFLWTPPHFWALAIAKKADYEATGIPVFPVVYGVEFTGLHMVLYVLLLFLVGIFPYLMNENSGLYLIGAIFLNGVFLWMVLRFVFGEKRFSEGMQIFYFSILYIPLFFLLLLVDRYWLIGY